MVQIPISSTGHSNLRTNDGIKRESNAPELLLYLTAMPNGDTPSPGDGLILCLVKLGLLLVHVASNFPPTASLFAVSQFVESSLLLGQLNIASALVLPSSAMTFRHRKNLTGVFVLCVLAA
ncbi:hypothetical protein T265_10956 [Opisthorchis viverrini]|uniref:Uncharacterized protein n=1 Tax=Opisthorchis viverrini TaxID=6198 RepID=A0A074Z0D8_OPIVI|nr:hypothetical protein T265_10956 [Opisthorchis viverrini]KER20506.1 hypothetical protein T265_10956 [Opisthorchis viverrini]